MNDKQISVIQDAALDGTARTQEDAPPEAVGEHRRKGVSPYSLVPALTLIALQFVKDEGGAFDFIIQSLGGSGHRPEPPK